MPKTHTKFVCQQCGYESAKWMGRCPDCGEWNTLVETVADQRPTRRRAVRRWGGASVWRRCRCTGARAG